MRRAEARRGVLEAEFQRAVVEAARLNGWLVHHDRPTRQPSGRWATAVQGDIGFPDLVLSRDGVVMFRELKTERGRMSPEQSAWGKALSDFEIWRPKDWPHIQEQLKRS